MNAPSKIGQSQAQLLMSKLSDGELSSQEAELLDAYLQQNPEAMDWMESSDLAQEHFASQPASGDHAESIAAIQTETSQETAPSQKPAGTLLRFPAFARPLAAAAAIALVGTVTWLEVRPAAETEFEPNIVEYVASDIPDSSTYIYSDEESGWTVVWVDADSAEYDSQG